MVFPDALSLRSRRAIVVALDLTAILAALFAAFLIRFEFILDGANLRIIGGTVWFFLGAHMIAAILFGLYRGMYHYSSVSDLIATTKAVTTGGVVAATLILFVRQGQFPRSVLVLHPILSFLGISGVRLGIRMIRNYRMTHGLYLGDLREVIIVGAGDLGESLARQMEKTPDARYKIEGFIDDDEAKWGMMIHGYPVLGGRDILADVLRKKEIDEIVIAIASRRGDLVRAIVEILRGVPNPPEIKVAPSLEEMLSGPQTTPALRRVNPADLLNRSVVRLDEKRISGAIAGRCVLVTGAGGTIGAELCRQALRYAPARLVVLEAHATSLFYIERELKEKTSETAIFPVLGDVRDADLAERIFAAHAPHIVLHAAAHKHVHQLEHNVHEGIVNNVLGTRNMASAAARHGTEVFLLVSTDKAVRPRSVMGATKRVAELVVRDFARRSKTRFIGVRFGNVLGSSGSVMQIFQEQIARGGPVTLTDARATRYFMTVEEAVGLILQAVSIAKGGEIFVLKMGTPVNIMDMARNMILLSGLEPGKDIEIRETGLKQGEKLDEELIEDASAVSPSEHPDITVIQPDAAATGFKIAMLDGLEAAMKDPDPIGVIDKLKELVPTFDPAEAHRQAK
jgi:FlaA1/EpsC-like NDP-sugar epimerase